MKYVLDASAAICWVVRRPLTPKAIRLRDDFRQSIHHLLAPDMFIDEVASGLTKAERQKLISVGQAASLYAQVMNEPVALLPHLSLVTRANDISSRTPTGYYDCLYLAPARSSRCHIPTA